MFVVVTGVALGVITLLGVVLAWRDKRHGVVTVIVSRVLGAGDRHVARDQTMIALRDAPAEAFGAALRS